MLAVLLAAPLILAAQSAFAAPYAGGTAANTEIVNTATLSYTGGSKQATALVTVSLVPSTPTIVLNGNSAGYLGPDSPVLADSLLLTSNANGPATYHVTAAIGSSGTEVQVNNSNTGSVSDGNLGAGFDVILGASVTTATATRSSTANTLVIPRPNTANLTGGPGTWVVNGLSVGSLVKYSTFSATITAITENPDNSFTLTLDTSSGVVPAGTPIFEQKTVAGITAKPGTVVAAGTDIVVWAQATVTTANAPAGLSNWAKNFWTSALASTELNKFVRNLTAAGNPTALSGACWTGKTNFTVNTVPNDYFGSSCVTGKTGDILEYVVLAKNTSATADLTNTAISDSIPTAYVTFNFNSYGGNDVFYSPDGTGSGTTSFLAAALNANQASFSPWPFPAPVPANVTLTVNVGSGANATTKGTMAKVVAPATATSLFIAYKVTIK